jgi:hypothetical protein
MVLRRATADLLEAEKGFRKIMGYRDLWVLKAVLHERSAKKHLDSKEEAA